jgi:hypothetical protein
MLELGIFGTTDNKRIPQNLNVSEITAKIPLLSDHSRASWTFSVSTYETISVIFGHIESNTIRKI